MNIGAKGEEVGRLILIDDIYIMAENLLQPIKKPTSFPSKEELNKRIESLEDINDIVAYNFFVSMGKWLELQVMKVRTQIMGIEASLRAIMCLTTGSLMYESFLIDASEQGVDHKKFERMEVFNFFQITNFDEDAKTVKDFKTVSQEFYIFYKEIVNYNEIITALKEITGIKEFNKLIVNLKKLDIIERYDKARHFYDEIIYTEFDRDKREKIEKIVTKELLPELPNKRTISNKKNIDLFKKRILEDPEIFRKPLEIQKILKG